MGSDPRAPGFTDIVFDDPPGPVCGRFIEVEDEHGASIRFGEWVQRDDGLWALRLPANARLISAAPEMYGLLAEVDLDNQGKLGSAHSATLPARIQSVLAKARGEG